MKTIWPKSLIILLIASLGFAFHYKELNRFPKSHVWAQADRFAISLGFVNNGLNFFRPETFIFNHQFPSSWLVPSTESITAVDFPIHDYIPAVIMKITGTRALIIFKFYVLLCSFVGLYFLFRLSNAISNSPLKSFLIVAFAATAPVFVSYQCCFLPSVPSLSCAIIGLYYYISYLKENEYSYFNRGIFFLTLATLSRTTFLIVLLSVLANELLRIIKKQSDFKPLIVSVLLSFASLISYRIYNSHLRSLYGSDFLSQLVPPANLKQALELISISYKTWVNQYYSIYHYGLITVLIIVVLILAFLKKLNTSTPSGWGNLIWIMFSGYIMFLIVMMRQFPNHDYYLLDTFFLPLLLLLIFLLNLLPEIKGIATIIMSVLTITFLSMSMISYAFKIHKQRSLINFNDRVFHTIINYKGSEDFLDSINIPTDKKILVIDAYAPNIPFIFMNRKGFVVMNTYHDNIETAMKWSYDFIVTQNEFFLSDIISTYPEFYSHAKKIADNGKITVWSRSSF